MREITEGDGTYRDDYDAMMDIPQRPFPAARGRRGRDNEATHRLK